ncbi:nuclear transport factor 2 family protein [Sphingomonas tabacisoli]|uniref:Nuclear transport factor 2 family protein n=1 Tax=Sphingomonas tabacisoli TaxID=2249466 RepID=A0ABW4I709_9SPHN
MSIDEQLAREGIRACLARLARGEDRRDAGLIRSAFWPEARLDYGVFEGDFAAYLAWVVPGSEAILNTQHVLGQSYIELSGGTAKAETQVISYHRFAFGAGDERDSTIGGRYLDAFEQREGEWRIAARTMIYDWLQDGGAAVDWGQGLMGNPLSAPHFAGRAHGDWSESFFGASA